MSRFVLLTNSPSEARMNSTKVSLAHGMVHTITLGIVTWMSRSRWNSNRTHLAISRARSLRTQSSACPGPEALKPKSLFRASTSSMHVADANRRLNVDQRCLDHLPRLAAKLALILHLTRENTTGLVPA